MNLIVSGQKTNPVLPTTISAALLLSALQSAGFAQPVPPSFYARPDTLAVGCLSFGVLLVGDLNNDGNLDLVCSPVLLGNGNGTFRVGQDIENYGSYLNGALADLNGDGNLDIVYPYFALPGQPTEQINLLFGNGDGTFQAPVVEESSAVTDLGPFATGIGDFNGDGIPDVVEIGTDYGIVFFGTGGGSFKAGRGFTVKSDDNSLVGLFVTDVNRDGKPDLVVLYLGNEMLVLLGNGNGTFQKPILTTLPFGAGAVAFAVGDVNGDGFPDVAVSNNTNKAILLGEGNGTFGSPLWADLPNAMFGLTLADVNGDGVLDLINGNVEVAFGKGDGTFGHPVYWAVEEEIDNLHLVVAADLRNNGRNDVIATNGAINSVLLNTGKGAFEDSIRTAIPGGSVSCAEASDFNGDGVPDIVVLNASGIQIMLGTGKVTAPFKAGAAYALSSALCPVVGDLNGDGIPDLLLASGSVGGAGSVIAYLGNGDGTFTQGATSAVPDLGTLALGDFNGDGKLDYATITNLLAYGNGDGSFGTPSPYIPSIRPQTLGFIEIVVADFAGKSKPGIILADYEDLYPEQVLYVLYNDGAAGWNEQFFSNGTGLSSLRVNYVRGGREPDISGVSDGMTVLATSSQGTLSQAAVLVVDQLNPGGFSFVTDVNGDGIPDAIYFAPGEAAVFLGTGDNQFESGATLFGTGDSPAAAFTLNLHHQNPLAGKPDLVEVDSSGAIYTLINETK